MIQREIYPKLINLPSQLFEDMENEQRANRKQFPDLTKYIIHILENRKQMGNRNKIKDGIHWAGLTNDPKFSEYLKNNFKGEEITSSDYEAICRGYYD